MPKVIAIKRHFNDVILTYAMLQQIVLEKDG